MPAPAPCCPTCSHHHDDAFLYEDGPDEEAALEAADLWDPTDFYYDDDPEEYELDLEECAQVMMGKGWSRLCFVGGSCWCCAEPPCRHRLLGLQVL